jgi:hypothetical protein
MAVLPSHSSRERTKVLVGTTYPCGRCPPHSPDRNIRYQKALPSIIRAVK